MVFDLIPNVVDRCAQTKPDAIYAEYPISPTTYRDGYRRITYKEFANIINGIAKWLIESLGVGKQEVLAYIGPNDIRYPALIIGASKANYTLFLPSPRNSLIAQKQLLQKLDCRQLIAPKPLPAAVDAIVADHEIQLLEVPSFHDLMNQMHPHIAFNHEYKDTLSKPFFVVHTSGSTGIPKPLVFTHATGLANTAMMALEPPPGFDSLDRVYQGRRVFLTFPPFHGAYLVSQIFNAINFGTTIISPLSGAITSAEGLVEALKQTHVDVAFLVPSIVHELSANAALLESCSQNLNAILYCGGDLPAHVGNVVAAKIPLMNSFGATELGLTAQLLPLEAQRDRQDWKYAHFHPAIGLELRHVAEDMYELYAVRDASKSEQQPTFTIFPELQEYASRDLFVRHPSKDKADLWSWKARSDDIIVFLNGEKTNPISMEQHVVSRIRDIGAALVFGAQRFQAGLLIELTIADGKALSPSDRAAFIEKIWPTIEEANKEAPAHARIAKSHILFTDPRKPLLRAGKGTIQRSGSLALYAKEIDKIYVDADIMSSEVNETHMELLNLGQLRTTVHTVLDRSNIGDQDDLFNLGMDSLQALTIVRHLRPSTPTIALSTVYTSRSIEELYKTLTDLNRIQKGGARAAISAKTDHRTQMIQERQEIIDEIMPSASKYDARSKGSTEVILTGSTGGLGSYMLHYLLQNPLVKHVYCLNRAVDGPARQRERNRMSGLPIEWDQHRVTFLTADLGEEGFGLDRDIFEHLLHQVDLIIHNAWPVNFNLSLATFRPQLDSIVHFVDFTAKALRSPHLSFVSSISSVMGLKPKNSRIEEVPIIASDAPGPNGYAESKHVAEVLLDYASQKLGIRTSFSRVGQLAGAVKHASVWNRSEWFPSLVTSSLHLHALPQSLGLFNRIDWVPIDLAADVLVDLAFGQLHESAQSPAEDQRSSRVFHVVNPHVIDWTDMSHVVSSTLGKVARAPVGINSTQLWLKKVKEDLENAVRRGTTAADTDRIGLDVALKMNPAAKLMEFYGDAVSPDQRSGTTLQVIQTLRSATKLGEIGAIREEWMTRWIEQWYT